MRYWVMRRSGSFLRQASTSCGRAVGAVVVVGGVGEVAVGLALDQRRAVAPAGVAHRGVDRGVDVEGVVAVDDDAAEAVGVGAVGDVVDRRLRRHRHRDGVAVVLADEHHRELVDAGEVERLVEVALGGGALAEVADDHPVLAAELGGVGEAGGVGELGRDRGRAGDDVALGPAPVVRHLASAAVRIVGPRQHGQEDLLHGHAEGEHHAGVAVVGEDDVVAGPQRPGRADLHALVALAGHDEGRLAHAVQRPDLLVEDPGREDGAVHPDEVVRGQPEVRCGGRGGGARTGRRRWGSAPGSAGGIGVRHRSSLAQMIGSRWHVDVGHRTALLVVSRPRPAVTRAASMRRSARRSAAAAVVMPSASARSSTRWTVSWIPRMCSSARARS